MFSIGELARHGRVSVWLGVRGLAPAGAPFFKYNFIDMTRELEVEAGVPVAAAVDGDGEVSGVVSGVLPAGRYATLTHQGHPSELLRATKALLDWAAGQALSWDASPDGSGERWGAGSRTT
jgi:effector-binding domain-containing protein